MPTARALWFNAPGAAAIRTETLPARGSGAVEIETLHSLVSRGTERLVFEGRVPESEWSRMRAPMQEGEFPFPVKHGYASVGRVVAGPDALAGRTVFALVPHQDRLVLPARAVLPVPDGVPPARAALAANMETALNALWDAELRPGAKVAVVGMGLLGCLVAALLARRSDLDVMVSDVVADRAEIARELSVRFAAPDDLPDDRDRVFHTSASDAGLAASLAALAFEGEVIELSWYGDRQVAVPLGGAFHARRLAIRSSQVGHVAPSRRAALSHRDRLARALAALDDPCLDALLTERVAFGDLPAALPRLLAPGAPGIGLLVEYR